MFWLGCWRKRSKLLFNVIKVIIMSCTYANPGREKGAFQNTENKTLSQRVRIPCDFNCGYKLAMRTPQTSKIVSLFKAVASSAYPFCQFFPT